MKKISETEYECPSFVDTHSHDDLILFEDPARSVKTHQGVGVQVIGNCGISPFPVLPEGSDPVQRLFDSVIGRMNIRFGSVYEYRRRLDRPDVVVLQGYNALRCSLFGPSPRKLDASERKSCASAVSRSIEDGAAGLSLGLAYLPAVGADTTELVEVARTTPLLTVHLRNESSSILESLDEAVDIARRARCALHVSHLKISGRPYWEKSDQLLKKIQDAHDTVGATFDHYPYAYGCTGLSAVLPPEISSLDSAGLANVRAEDVLKKLEDDSWENYVRMCGWSGLKLTALEKYPEYNGISISETGVDPVELVLKLVRDEPHPAVLIYSQNEELIDELLKLPYGCVGTDGLPMVTSHPRLTSSFPEYIGRCRRIGMSVEMAVEKAAILPRKIFKIGLDVGGRVRFNWADGRVKLLS